MHQDGHRGPEIKKMLRRDKNFHVLNKLEFDTNKGFGFISPDVGGADVFVHQSVIQAEGFRSLAQGEKVEYKLGMNEKTGRHQAAFVSGPDGANVEGAPFTPFF